MEALEHEETATVTEEGGADKLTAPKPQKPRKDLNALAPPLIRTSRAMSYILRHGSKKEGLKMRPDGYVKVEDLVRPRSPRVA
jgi:RNA:NAD 2'-phosphotransferase (TPT1/KptA family)